MQQSLYNAVSVKRLKAHAEAVRSGLVSIIESQAGIRYRQLARMAGLANGVLSHHIKILERQKRITVWRDAGATRFFPYWYDRHICDRIAQTCHPTTRTIAMLLMKRERTCEQIKAELNRSRSTISTHIQRLMDAGLIFSKRNDERLLVYGILDFEKTIEILNGGIRQWQA